MTILVYCPQCDRRVAVFGSVGPTPAGTIMDHWQNNGYRVESVGEGSKLNHPQQAHAAGCSQEAIPSLPR